MQYNYSDEKFAGRAKPIRIIGEPDNQSPDKWRFTVLYPLMCCFFVDSAISLEGNDFSRVNMDSLLNYMHCSATFRV